MEIRGQKNPINLDKSILGIKENSEFLYRTFVNDNRIVLKNTCLAGNNSVHYLDLKLTGNKAYERDTYKAVIMLEVEQK